MILSAVWFFMSVRWARPVFLAYYLSSFPGVCTLYVE